MKEEIEKNEVENKDEVKDEGQKLKDKKNSFTLIYILVGILGIAVLGMLLYAFIVTR